MRKLALSFLLPTLVWAANAAAADPPGQVSSDVGGPQTPIMVTTPTTPAATTPLTTGTPSDVPAATTTTTSAEAEAAARTTAAPPADTPAPETTSWVNRPLLVTSAILLVGSYVPMAAIAYTSDRPADQTNLYYPVVGPWMNLADRQCDVRACNNEGLNKAMLILDGVGQGLGALGVVTSFFLPNTKTRNWYLIGDAKTHAGPTRVGTGYGFGAAGHF